MQEDSKSQSFQEEWIKGPDDIPFYTRLWPTTNPARAVVLYVHGFMEHVGRYDRVFPIWTAQGIAVFAYDQRGFGKTCFNGVPYASAPYGRTSGIDQVRDMEFFLKEVDRRFPNIPFFLMGFSMGGGRALHFVTRTTEPPSPDSVKRITGIIAYAPHVREARPVPKVVRLIGSFIKIFSPYKTFRTDAVPEHFSHDPVTNKEWADDPMILAQGTLRGLGDLLADGEELLSEGYLRWPKNLPILTLHGTEDPVTCNVSSKEFHDKLTIKDKEYYSFPGAFHELHNEPSDKDRFHDICLKWIEAHLPKPADHN